MSSSQMAELIRNTNWAETPTWRCDFLAILAENLRADYSRFEISHVYLVEKASRQYLSIFIMMPTSGAGKPASERGG